jgi:hypothetical protein
MTFEPQMEDTPVEILFPGAEGKVVRAKGMSLTRNVSPFTSCRFAPFEGLAAKGHGRWLLC